MTSNQASKAQTFVELHRQSTPFVIPNPWDIGTARILAGLGFSALATTSAGLAYSLGRRDGTGAVSRDEALAHARTIVAATPLPVSADLENGFGDQPETVAETVRLAAASGLVGCSIEDATTNPKQPIYEFNLALERIEAAVSASQALDFPFTLTARAENFLHGKPDLDDTIRRLQAFDKAGADVLCAPGLRDIDAIRTVCESVQKPVNVIMGIPGSALTLADLAAVGVRRISVGSSLARLAFGAFLRAAEEIQADGTFGFASQTASFAELDKFMSS